MEIMEPPIKMDDLGVPLFLETPFFLWDIKVGKYILTTTTDDRLMYINICTLRENLPYGYKRR